MAPAQLARAAGATLYVDRSSASCSDSGSGSPSQPFCSIGKAAQVAQAGDTVAVTGGAYTGGSLNPTNSGTSGSPITFTATPGVTVSGGVSAFAISSRSYIVINGFTITSTSGYGIVVSSSNHITVSNNKVTGAGQRAQGSTAGGISLSGTTSSLVTHNTTDNNSDHGILISGASANNTISFNEASLNAEGWQRNANGINVIGTGSTGNILIGNLVHDNEDSGLQFYPGANNGLAADNITYNNGDHGIDDLNVTGGELIGNTVYHNCTSGINVEGTSGSYTVMNNISVDNAVYPAYNGISCSRRTGNIGIYDSAPATTTVDYNLVYLTTGGHLYVWANTAYSSPAALCTATGQDCHGIQSDPKWISWTSPNFHLQAGSPAIDSANSGAPGEQATDADGNPRVDDPSTPNTGAGPRTYDDRGAYELQSTGSDTQPPTVPTGLTAPTVGPTSVSLAWNASTDNFVVTGYTIYRNATVVATSPTSSFTDTGLQPTTSYTYTVDAFDAAGNHSAQSTSVTATTGVQSIGYVQSAAFSKGKVTTTTFSLKGTVGAGDLLTGLFTQRDAAGQVHVSDNVNGPWIRIGGIPYASGKGDIAVFYLANSRASATGVTITISASAPTNLTGAVGEYSGVAASSPLDQMAIRSGSGTSVDSGPTASVAAGELVFGAMTANSNPGTVTGGSSQGLAFTMRSASGNTSDADILGSNAGTQNARFTLGNSVTWYAAAAVFRPAATTPDSSPPATPTGLTATNGAGSVVLGWNSSTDNIGVTGYTLYRNGSALATVGGAILSYTDATVASATIYGYSVDAFDAAGNHSAQSAVVNDTTLDWIAPTVPGSPSATAAGPTQVNVGWSASIDNVGVAGYTVFRNGSQLATVSGTTLAYSDLTAAPSTSYTYTVDAFDAAGNHSAQSQPAAVTTPAQPDTTPPSTPTGLAAQATGPTQVNLAWNASTDDVGIAGYTVYRNGSQLAIVSGTTLTYPDRTAAPSTSYAYTVDAFDAAGNRSAQSLPAGATTPSDTTAPSTPGGLTALAPAPAQVNLTWSASTDEVGVTGYTVFRDGAVLTTVGAGTLGYTDSTVAAATSYSYTVDAFDAAGNHSAQSQPATVTTPSGDSVAPSTPTGLLAVAASSTQVNLTWNASTDNVGVAGYTVYRNGSTLATVSGATLTYSDTAVSQATNYSYTVDAFDAAGNHSAQSVPSSVHVPARIQFVQGKTFTTGSRVTTTTVTLGPVSQGDLLVGWFGQYDSIGQVSVSDNVNGAWTRSASTTWNGSSGDIALYYFANATAAPSGITITISATNATYLQGGPAEYSGVATVNPLDQVVVAKGTGTSADSGLTAPTGAGDLIYGGMTATSGAGTLTPGSSLGVTFVKRAQSSSGSQGAEDIVTSTAGQQHAGFTFTNSVPWFMVCAVFKPA